MSIRFRCPTCQKAFTANAAGAGKRVRCPGCQSTVTIPRSQPVPDPPDWEEVPDDEADDSLTVEGPKELVDLYHDMDRRLAAPRPQAEKLDTPFYILELEPTCHALFPDLDTVLEFLSEYEVHPRTPIRRVGLVPRNPNRGQPWWMNYQAFSLGKFLQDKCGPAIATLYAPRTFGAITKAKTWMHAAGLLFLVLIWPVVGVLFMLLYQSPADAAEPLTQTSGERLGGALVALLVGIPFGLMWLWSFYSEGKDLAGWATKAFATLIYLPGTWIGCLLGLVVGALAALVLSPAPNAELWAKYGPTRKELWGELVQKMVISVALFVGILIALLVTVVLIKGIESIGE